MQSRFFCSCNFRGHHLLLKNRWGINPGASWIIHNISTPRTKTNNRPKTEFVPAPLVLSTVIALVSYDVFQKSEHTVALTWLQHFPWWSQLLPTWHVGSVTSEILFLGNFGSLFFPFFLVAQWSQNNPQIVPKWTRHSPNIISKWSQSCL